MKKILGVISLMAIAMVLGACHDNAKKPVATNDDTTAVVENVVEDTTVYGVCGANTAMHTLELITTAGDTLSYLIDEETTPPTQVLGGLLAGDRMAVVGGVVDGERVARRIINLSTLLGKWTSLDRNFEIQEEGVVASSATVESNPWKTWKIVNGHLVLNADTFDINSLGADSLYIENDKGIFVYQRPNVVVQSRP